MSSFKISGVIIKEQSTDILDVNHKPDKREYTMCASMYMIYGDRGQYRDCLSGVQSEKR